MEIIIDIPEARYKDIQRIADAQLEMNHFQTAEQIISKGVPLEQEPCDAISRQAAIDALGEKPLAWTEGEYELGLQNQWQSDVDALNGLPSAQPGIIRCKDCKYRDENWRRVSVRWLPCMDVRTGSNWYCGSAERKDDE